MDILDRQHSVILLSMLLHRIISISLLAYVNYLCTWVIWIGLSGKRRYIIPTLEYPYENPSKLFKITYL